MDNDFDEYVSTEVAPNAVAQQKPSILLLTCIDNRYAHRIVDLMDRAKLRGKYDIFALAGAAAGANENKKIWRQALVEHIQVARLIKHPLDRVIILEHRDCGAYKEFFGLDWEKVTPPVELNSHKEQATLLMKYLKKIFAKEIPNLKVDSFLLTRDQDDVLLR